jgi:hypothetical protein
MELGYSTKAGINDDSKKGRVECTGYISANCMQPNFRQGVLRSEWSRMDGFTVITSQLKWKYIVQKRAGMGYASFPNITP